MVGPEGTATSHLRNRVGALAPTVAGVLVLVALWEAIGSLALSKAGVVPTPIAVVASMIRDGSDFYLQNAAATVQEAATGWLIGNVAALVLGVVCVAVPAASRSVTTLGIATFCLPSVAILPIFAIIWSGTSAPEVALAALAVYFTTFTGVVSGLRGADTAALDAVSAFGGSRVQQLLLVRLRFAVPTVFAGLKVAAPASILGAMIGEFIGGTSGLGVAMISSEQALDIPRTWGIAVFVSLLAGAAYAVTGLVGRWLGAGISVPPIMVVEARASDSLRTRSTALRSLARLIASGAALLAFWWGFLLVFQVDPFIGKNPVDVAVYLAGGGSQPPWRIIGAQTLVSVGHAVVGLAVGAVGGVLAALLFSRFQLLQRMFFPIAVVVSTVPLVAFTPLIALVFGRGLLSVALIGGIVTFFPVLVFVTQGLGSVDPRALDLCTAYGAGRRFELLRVRLPWALPSLVAALRVAAPLALVGALLAEWLATGDGLGYSILTAGAVSDYDGVWARVAVATACSFGLYFLVGAGERLVATRMFGGGIVRVPVEHPAQGQARLGHAEEREGATA